MHTVGLAAYVHMLESSVPELHAHVIVVTNPSLTHIRARLFTLSSDLALGMTKDPRGPPTDVMRAKSLFLDLHNVTLLDESSSR